MWGILLILIIQSKVPNECTLFYSPWWNQYHPMQMEIFCQKNGLTEVQNVMHNKSFFVRHIYSGILKTILEPPSVGDKIFRHGFSKLNVHKIYLLLFIITKDVCWWCLYTEFITYFLSQTCFGTESDSVFCSLGKTEKKP